MPGMYTFYDGSTRLQPIADAFGMEINKINLVACQLISLPLAYLHYSVLSPSNVSRNTRVAFPAICGLIMCYFCYGNAMKHLVLLVVISYVIMHLSPPQIVHKSVFLFSMGYLVFIHWYRWYSLATYSVDVTGSMMVIVQKITAVGFSLHDGKVKKNEELNDIQKREALKSLPSVLDFVSYIFHFQAILTGPACFFTDYVSWIDGTAAIGKDGKIEKPWRAVVMKLLQVSLFMFLYVYLCDYYTPDIIIDDIYMNLNWVFRFVVLYVMMLLERLPYYYAWTFADAIFNLSGFGFRGYDSDGRPQWDLVSNVKAWKVETASNFKETLEAWNCCTMHWLRRVAYDRVPKRYRTVSTYLLSAVWHGFFMGYYVTFLTGALFTVSARSARRSLRWRFQRNRFSQLFYDVVTFFVTKIALSYATFPFVMMHLGPGLYFYRRMYFCLHIAALFILFVLPHILPPETVPVKKDTNNDVKKSS